MPFYYKILFLLISLFSQFLIRILKTSSPPNSIPLLPCYFCPPPEHPWHYSGLKDQGALASGIRLCGCEKWWLVGLGQRVTLVQCEHTSIYLPGEMAFPVFTVRPLRNALRSDVLQCDLGHTGHFCGFSGLGAELLLVDVLLGGAACKSFQRTYASLPGHLIWIALNPLMF